MEGSARVHEEDSLASHEPCFIVIEDAPVTVRSASVSRSSASEKAAAAFRRAESLEEKVRHATASAAGPRKCVVG